VKLLFFAGALVVVAVVAAARLGFAGRRRAALRTFANSFGLEYSPTDLFGLIDHRFRLFALADGARCSNVLWGNWHGAEVRVGELRFETDPELRRRDLWRSTRRFSFAVVDLDAWLPRLAIRRDPLASVSESLLVDRLRFESDAFNRMYSVDCADLRFAYKFVDPRMMLWLQEMGETFRFDFEVNGDKALVSVPEALRVRPIVRGGEGTHRPHPPDRVPRPRPGHAGTRAPLTGRSFSWPGTFGHTGQNAVEGFPEQ
jgi:hypothetical protein